MVPLTIPWMRSMWAPASDSESTRTTGTTPATAASKRSCTPCSPAAAKQLLPMLGEQLLVGGDDVAPGAHRAQNVVARGFDAAEQLDRRARESSRISSKRPPRAREGAGEHGGAPGEPRDMRQRARRAAGERGAHSAPAEQADGEGFGGRGPPRGSGEGCVARSPAEVAEPKRSSQRTSRAIRSSKLSRRTTARASAARAEDDRRAGYAVVVVGHRMAVGAGGGRHHDVARPRVVEQRMAHDDVAGLAVLAGEHARELAAEDDRRCGLRRRRRRASGEGCRTCRRRRPPRWRRCA